MKNPKIDLVTIPREEYEALLRQSHFLSFSPTEAQKKALIRAEKNLLMNRRDSSVRRGLLSRNDKEN